MHFKKKILTNLTKCYSIAPLNYFDQPHFLVAAEKTDACLLFDYDGNLKETVWTEPGGTMSMVQVPGSKGQFLATHKFYSPNDSKEAKIVIATPKTHNDWEIRTLVNLPHVHRFDIISRNNVYYLIACTLKSGHEYKEDWSMPGAVYAAKLPDDLSIFNDENQLQLTMIKDGMLRNHGYYRQQENDIDTALITCAAGVFQFTPPQDEASSWTIVQLLDQATSDATLIDLDNDGELELLTLSPFHGSHIRIHKKINGNFEKVYEHKTPTEFLHAMWSGYLKGKPVAIVGHREGTRDLILFSYDEETQTYLSEIIDHGCGPANIAHFQDHDKDFFVATNREIDEIAMYRVE